MRATFLTVLSLFVACGPGLPDKADGGSSTGGADEAGGDLSGIVTSSAGGGTTTGGEGGETTTSGAGGGTATGGLSLTGEPTGADPGASSSSGQDPGATEATTQEPEPEPWPPLSVYLVTLLSLKEGEQEAFAEVPKFATDPDFECRPVSCDANAAPTLGEPIFFVNGAWTQTLDLHVGDRVGVALPFADVDCNLGCGSIWSGASGPFEMSEGGGSGPGLPCASGPGLGIDFTTLEAPGPHDWFIRIEDACGAQSEAVKGEFEVAP